MTLYAPDTDRINVDLLTSLGGVLDITIVRVDFFSEKNAKGRPEEKARLWCAEHELPYIPGKMMGRALIGVWGIPGDAWIGQRMRLYIDPGVSFGGATVGGVRVSHVSGIERETVVMITTRRGQRSPWSLKPIGADRLTDALKAAGLTVEQLDAWGSANGQPLVATMDARGRDAAAAWLADGGAGVVSEFVRRGRE